LPPLTYKARSAAIVAASPNPSNRPGEQNWVPFLALLTVISETSFNSCQAFSSAGGLPKRPVQVKSILFFK